MALDPARVPVIVGIGEITEKTRDPLRAQEPAALMAEALRRAADDAHAALLPAIDALEIVCEHSWPYPDIGALLRERLGIAPPRCEYHEAGGESPVRLLHDAALRIARGESRVAAVVGAEAAYSVAAAAKAGIALPWSPRDPKARLLRGQDLCHPLAVAHGVVSPAQVYPLYENAAQAAWNQTQGEALQESGELWARYSAVAAENPYAWLRKPYGAGEIVTPTADNRLIAWPYTKHMVANPLVNQGAAVLVTSLARARELGIAESHWVYFQGGAAAKEPRDYLQRDQYAHSPAQDAVLDAALAVAGGDATRFAQVELYSCFPVVPKMARRRLGLPADAPLTSTGGLSFFGAPLNNYMTHAAAGLVRRLRQQPGALALLYGQGEFVTKHHALVLASAPPATALEPDYSVQAQANRARGEVPDLVADYDGDARLETFTVLYGRDGTPDVGFVVGRTPNGARLVARVARDDRASLEFLTRLSARPVGSRGRVRRGANALLQWELTDER